MKNQVVLLVLLGLVISKDAPFYGSVSTDPLVHQSFINQPGLTNDYRQMLKNPSNYFVSMGVTNKKVDLSKQVVVNGGQGEINFEEYNKKTKGDQYAKNYRQMLANADKKLLTLGIHPELQSPNTHKLMPQLEDPIFAPTPKEISQKQKELELKVAKIKQFMDMVEEELREREPVNWNQKQLLQSFKQFIDYNTQNIILSKLSPRLEAILRQLDDPSIVYHPKTELVSQNKEHQYKEEKKEQQEPKKEELKEPKKEEQQEPKKEEQQEPKKEELKEQEEDKKKKEKEEEEKKKKEEEEKKKKEEEEKKKKEEEEKKKKEEGAKKEEKKKPKRLMQRVRVQGTLNNLKLLQQLFEDEQVIEKQLKSTKKNLKNKITQQKDILRRRLRK